MIIFPAIDIKDGQCVRLVQGRKETKKVYSPDPVEVACEWEKQGAQWLHIVDLDGAFSGVPVNSGIVRKLAGAVSIPFQVGGGIRNRKAVRGYLDIGASRVVIGTKAVEEPSLIRELIDEFGPERIVLGLDARQGMVAIQGWERTTGVPARDLASAMRKLGVKWVVYTDVMRDGMMEGPNYQGLEEMAQVEGIKLVASGGISDLEDVKKLAGIPGVEGVIIGKALYEGRIRLPEAIKIASGL